MAARGFSPLSLSELENARVYVLYRDVFTRLDSWYNDVRAKAAIVNATNNANKLAGLRDDLAGLASSDPVFSFCAIGRFLTAPAVLSFFVPAGATPVNTTLFLYIPLVAAVLIYWISGLTLLVRARAMLGAAAATIKSKI